MVVTASKEGETEDHSALAEIWKSKERQEPIADRWGMEIQMDLERIIEWQQEKINIIGGWSHFLSE